jgi:hypothetical protein
MIVPTSKVRRFRRGKMLFINGKRRKYARSGKLIKSCGHLGLRRAFDGTSKFRHLGPRRLCKKTNGIAPKNATEMVAHECGEHIGKVTSNPGIRPTVQI